jgi:hypothetical protein
MHAEATKAALRLYSKRLSGQNMAIMLWLVELTIERGVEWAQFKEEDLAAMLGLKEASGHIETLARWRLVQLPVEPRGIRAPWLVRVAPFQGWRWPETVRPLLRQRMHFAMLGPWCSREVLRLTDVLWQLVSRETRPMDMPEREPHDETWARWCRSVHELLSLPTRQGGAPEHFERIVAVIEADPYERRRLMGANADRLFAVRYPQLHRLVQSRRRRELGKDRDFRSTRYTRQESR